jgi:hypothetical protein
MSDGRSVAPIEYGDVVYVCPHDGTEWTGRGAMREAWGSLDPAAQDNSDRCVTCGEECDEVANWLPDTPEGYRIWLEAVEHVR